MREANLRMIILVVLLFPISVAHAQFTSKRRPSVAMKLESLKSPHSPPRRLEFVNENKSRVILYAAAFTVLVSNVDANVDEEYALETHHNPTRLIKSFGRFGKFYDSRTTYYYVTGITATAFAYGTLFKDEKAVNTVKMMVKAYAVSSVITSTLKLAIGRKRPYTDAGPGNFVPFQFSRDAKNMSFPSGHTCTIFSMMTVLAKQYPKPWVQIPAYTLAASVGFQRMLYRKHWFSDVVAGGAVGYLVGNAIVRHAKVRQPRRAVLQPVVGANRLGMAISF